jgi:type IV secretion system protein TrbG
VTKTIISALLLSAIAFAQTAPPQTAAAPAPASQQTASPAVQATEHRPRMRESDLPLRVTREAPLPEGAKKALSFSETSVDTGVETQMGTDGRIVFAYGTGVPTIVCALLNITEVDLAPGETVVKDGLDLGDGGKEFFVVVRHAGSGTSAYDYLTIKPISSNVEMTMTVGTTKHVYYLRVRATDKRFMTRITFSYPEEEAKAREQLARTLAQAQEAAAAALPTAVPAGKYGLNISAALVPEVKPWKYTIKKKGRDADYIVPLSVGDDGAHTHIQLSPEARMRGLPVLQIRDATGPIPANSHWDDTTLIVDALFEDGCLLEGVGKSQQRVCIHNQKLIKEKKNGSE